MRVKEHEGTVRGKAAARGKIKQTNKHIDVTE